MNFISLLVLLAFPVSAHASDLILEYDYGNQIYGSALRIYDDGKIDHQERSCCPPHEEPAAPYSMALVEVEKIKGQIYEASGGEISQQRSLPTSFGSQSGHLYVFLEGKKVLIYQADRGTVGQSDGLLSKNFSPASELIRDFVAGIVAHYPR